MSAVSQRTIKRPAARRVACTEQSDPRPVGEIVPMRPLLTLSPEGIHLAISGELDFSTAARLGRLLRLLEGFPNPLHVDLSGVLFTDSTGLSPLFRSAARRAAAGATPILLTRCSRQAQRVLDLLSEIDDAQLRIRGE